MNIRIKCVCGARLKAPEDCMGRSVRCSVCGNAVYVPPTQNKNLVLHANHEVKAWLRFACPCGKVVKAPVEWAGKKGNCPRCALEHAMPTIAPSNVPGEHDAETIEEKVEAPKPLKSLARPSLQAATEPPPTPAHRQHPRPQPRPVAGSAASVDEDMDRFFEGQTLQKSGLLDLTAQADEEVKIVDGVAPALWEAKREQRAKAIKAGPDAQAGYYRRRAITEQLALVRKRIDSVLYRSPAATFTLSGAVLLFASFFLYHQIASANPNDHWSSPSANVYFFDLKDGKLFAHSNGDPPPVMSPSQSEGKPMGVRAFVYSCGKCEDAASLYVGYLETYDPTTDAAEQQKKYLSLIAGGPSAEAADAESKAQAGRLVAGPEGAQWARPNDEAGQGIIATGTKACESGTAPTPCDPVN